MKIIISGNTYTAMDELSFNPETDLTNDSLPINEFEARLFTNNQISYGQWAELRDDNDTLWARYWLSYAERIGRDDDHETYIVKVIGQSPLAFLERIKLAPKFYSSYTAKSAIQEILSYVGSLGSIDQVVDSTSLLNELDSISVTGFAPEQTARERLQWILLMTGCYIGSYFDTRIHISKVNTSGGALIPIEATYWKPVISHRDYVTKIIVHAYSYIQGTPQSTDQYVTDGTNYWIQSETIVTLTNSNAPSGAPENEIDIEGVTLISQSNASTVITNLAAYYFNRTEVELECINNASYKPGERVTVYVNDDTLIAGYIDHCDFEFGVQAKSSLHLSAAESVDGARLTIQYKWGSVIVALRSYFLPKNFPYSITTEYLDTIISGHRYIFRPLTASVSGTLTENTTVTVNVEIAIDYFTQAISDKSIVLAQRGEVLAIVDGLYNSLVRYKHNENVLRVLQLIYIKRRDECNAMFLEMEREKQNTAHFMKILSVDEVEFDTEHTYRTVEIS